MIISPYSEDIRISSYTIYKSGILYKAVPHKAGLNRISGTVALDVLQEAVDNLTNGGLIYLAQGTFPVASKLTISTSNVAIKGAGQFLSVIQATESMESVLEITGSGWHIESLGVDANSHATIGVTIAASASRGFLHRVNIDDPVQDGLGVSNVSGGKISFVRVSLGSGARYGIAFDGIDMEVIGSLVRGISSTINRPEAAYYITGGGGSKFIGGHVWGYKNAALLVGANRVAFIGEALNDSSEHGVVFDTTSSYDIRFRGCEHRDVCRSANNSFDVYHVNVNVSRVSIIGCEAVAALTNKPRYFLNQASGTGTGCMLIGNLARNMQTGFASGWSDGVNSCVVAHNLNY